MSSSEALWRIYGYKYHVEYPSVQRLAIHLPNLQIVTYDETKSIDEIISKNTDTQHLPVSKDYLTHPIFSIFVQIYY